MSNYQKSIIGYEERVTLKNMGEGKILAKIDSGAEYSSLHAYELKIIRNKISKNYIAKFKLFKDEEFIKMEIAKFIRVKSSNGESQLRPVINVEAELNGIRIDLEVTLTDRESMKYDMLIGRRGLKGRFLIDVELNSRKRRGGE